MNSSSGKRRWAWRSGGSWSSGWKSDGKIPLYPPALSEGAGSLLPEQWRPAVLWTLDLDAAGDVGVVVVVVEERGEMGVFGPDAAEASRLRWDWQYRLNPQNPGTDPLIWIAREGPSIIGQYATMPVRLVVKGRDGRIHQRDSYGNDPRNVPG